MLIPVKERQMAIKLINTACKNGARQIKACEVVGISERTLQRWSQADDLEDKRIKAEKKPVNQLTEDERKKILSVCNQEEFSSLSPKQIVPILADRGIYIASESSFYRVLRQADQLNHRGNSSVPRKVTKPTPCVTTAVNQVWSWDITYLNAPVQGQYFYLYFFMDIYSRKIVGWEVHETESAELAAEVLRKTRFAEQVSPDQEIILHSDNGSPMKGATMLATMQKLGVVPSFSRPSVSNDNPYSESLFRTLKYVPVYPKKPFEDLTAARAWVSSFVHWYNTLHRHSSIQHVTPEQKHQGLDIELLAQRKALYGAAKKRHPNRWSGKTRNWNPVKMVELNPVNSEQTKKKKAA